MKGLVSFAVALFFTSTLHAHGVDYMHVATHTHGIVDLSVEWDETELIVTAAFPAQDVVGFEHIPANAAEKRLVRDAYKKFIDNPSIVANGCEPKKVDIASALFDEHADGESDGFLGDLLGTKKEADEETEVPDHMDFQAIYVFTCDAKNKPLSFNNFSIFPSLKQVRVYHGKIAGTASQVLSIKQPVIQPSAVSQ